MKTMQSSNTMDYTFLSQAEYYICFFYMFTGVNCLPCTILEWLDTVTLKMVWRWQSSVKPPACFNLIKRNWIHGDLEVHCFFMFQHWHLYYIKILHNNSFWRLFKPKR